MSDLPKPIPLADLHAVVQDYSGYLELDCPLCRTHRVVCARALDSGDIATLSILPRRASVLLKLECGAHFFVLDGQAVPAGSCGGWDD